MQTTDELQPLFTHSKRPVWGLAILAWEGDGERLYQFQDGQLRTFKEGYYELLKEVVDHPPERALDIVRDLKAMLRLDRGRREGKSERLVSFAEQIAVFEQRYPAGFADPKWVSVVRGGEGKRHKRHREPAIEQAGASLSAEALERAIASGEPHAVVEAARAVVAATDLVGSKDVGPLRKKSEADEAAFVRALRELLYGSGAYGARLGAYLDALAELGGRRVTWPLATVLPALVHPGEHLFVKPSVVRPQAQWIAPSLPYDASPSPALYERLRAMADEVRSRLRRAGHTPRDLLDVHDFMLETLRPRTARPLSSATPSPELAE